MRTPNSIAEMPAPPPRTARALGPLAEAIIAAIGEHYRSVGGDLNHHHEAKRRMLAQFADIGISPDQLRSLARVIQS